MQVSIQSDKFANMKMTYKVVKLCILLIVNQQRDSVHDTMLYVIINTLNSKEKCYFFPRVIPSGVGYTLKL
jgi:hypothetical protein